MNLDPKFATWRLTATPDDDHTMILGTMPAESDGWEMKVFEITSDSRLIMADEPTPAGIRRVTGCVETVTLTRFVPFTPESE